MTTPNLEPFVGRESELAELTAALDDALAGRGSLAVIAGEPGIGKTGISEAFEAIAHERGARTLWGRCYEEAGAPPYWPWVQAIRSYIREIDKDQLASEMGPGAADIADIVPDLREVLPYLPDPPPSDDPNAARFRLFDSMASFFRNASSRQPLVILLEDLHAADGDSLLLLEFVARELSDTNLLIVGTYRDVELSRRHPLSRTLAELRRSSRFRRLLLRRLDQAAVEEFVASAIGEIPFAGIAEAIYAETEGNPLFVTETLRLMRQEGRLSPEALRDFKPSDLSLPEGVREAIGRRLDALTDDCNELLTIAAVIGRQFEYRHLASLTADPRAGARPEKLSEDELADLLDEALDANVLEETTAPGADYQFTHALIKETLTDEISITRQARMHARVALMLEELHGEDPGEHAAEMAFHFGEAENVLGSEKLIRYSLIAGKQSRAAFAHEDAVVQFQRGLSAKEGQPEDLETAELLHGLGSAQMWSLTFEELDDAFRNLQKAFNLFLDAGLTERALAIPQEPMSNFGSANVARRDLLVRALEVAPENSPAAGMILARYGGALAIGLGDIEGGRSAIGKAVDIARRVDDPVLEARALMEQANLEAWALNFQKLADIATHAETLIDAENEQWISSRIGFFASAASFYLGDSAFAASRAHRGRASATRVRNTSFISGCASIEAYVLGFSGAWDEARELIKEVLPISGPDPRVFGIGAKVEYESGEFKTAAEYMQQIDALSSYFGTDPTLQRYFAVGSAADAAYITSDMTDLDSIKENAAATARNPARTPLLEHAAIYALAFVAVMDMTRTRQPA